MNRDTYVTEIKAAADATGSQRWTPATILLALDAVYQREWERIFGNSPYARVAARSVLVDSDGRIARSALDSGTGDARERFYRIIGLTVGEFVYKQALLSDNILTQSLEYQTESSARIYWRQGDFYHLWPKSNGSTATATVNHFPQLPSLLTNGSSELTWFEGYEIIPILESAAVMLNKGGTESGAGEPLKALADEFRDSLLARLSRESLEPIAWQYSDSRADWAG